LEHREWERSTLELLSEEQAERQRLEQRLVTAQHALEEVDQRVAAIQATLDAYRTRHGLTRPAADQVAVTLADEYHDLNYKEIVLKWADRHDGRVVMREMADSLTAAGIFSEKTKAAGALYPAIKRLPGFEKIRRGVYERRKGVDNVLAVKVNSQYEQAEQAGASEGSRLFGRGRFDPQYGPNDTDSQEHSAETTD
jgi:hypothetical protein